MLTEDQIEAMARANWPGIEWDDESLAESAHLCEAFRAGVRAIIAAHEAKAAPAVPDTDELESALERLVERCNTDQLLCNDDAVIHAEATLKRIYKSRKSTSTPAAPSQPVPFDQWNSSPYTQVLHETIKDLSQKLASMTQSQPVTLTDDKIEQMAVDSEIVFRHRGKLLTPFLEHIDLRRNVHAFANAIIAALREKEQAK